MSEANKALYRRFVDEVINKKNLAVMDELMNPDYIEHDEMPPGMASGVEGMKQMMGMFFSAFPDMQTTTEDVIAEGDLVVGRHITTGTHRGDFMGIPATGSRLVSARSTSSGSSTGREWSTGARWI